MRRHSLKILPVVGVALLAVAGQASGAPQHVRAASSVRVVMKDPGCHWFAVGGKLKAKLAVKGPTSLLNLDEAALNIVGSGSAKRVAVGKKITLARGSYKITMVKQHADDNTLRLIVR